eukprot:SAG31_NODE_42925_length_269_cov_0.905882_1_plen_82_part_01
MPVFEQQGAWFNPMTDSSCPGFLWRVQTYSGAHRWAIGGGTAPDYTSVNCNGNYYMDSGSGDCPESPAGAGCKGTWVELTTG